VSKRRTSDAGDFERLTRTIFEGILRLDGLEDAKVLHNVTLQGLSGSHQIDVLWTFRIGGNLYTTILEAKHWERYVGIRDVRAFKALLDDFPERRPHGVLVSSSGFQRGARRFANVWGIQLCTLVRAESVEAGPLIFFQETSTELTCGMTRLLFVGKRGEIVLDCSAQPAETLRNLAIAGDGTRRSLEMLIDVLVHRAVAEETDELQLDFFDNYFLEDKKTGDRQALGGIAATFAQRSTPRTELRDLRGFFSHILSGMCEDETILIAPNNELVRLPKDVEVGMCDFCGYPIAKRDLNNVFTSRTIGMLSLGPTVDGFRSQMSNPKWGACGPCASFIRVLDVEGPVKRHVEMAKFVPGAKSAEAARHVHDLFWLGYLKEQSLDERNLANPTFVLLARQYEELEIASEDAFDSYHRSEITDAAARRHLIEWPTLRGASADNSDAGKSS
jgi:hypothetical protein